VRRLPALAGALWFAAHPVHAEAIFFAVNREELLCAAFVLATLVVALGKPPAPGTKTARPVRPVVGVFILSTLALLSKETAVTLPVLLMTLPFLTERTPPRPRTLGTVAAAAAAVVGYLVLRWAALGRLGAAHIPWQDNPLVQADLADRLASALALVWKAGGLLVAPVGLTVDYGFDVLGLPAAAPNAATWLGLAVVVAVVAGFVAALRNAPAPALGLAVLAVAWAPVSNLLFPSSIILAERLLYLPSAGAALVVAGLLDRARGPRSPNAATSWLPASAILLVALMFAVMLADRNHDFRSGRTLFDASLAAHPRSTRLWNNLAIEYQNDGDWEASAVALERALAIDPTNAEAHNNLGLAQARRGDYRDAARSFGTALDLRPGMASALGNLCLLMEPQPDVARTLAICEMAVRRGAPVTEVLERVRARSEASDAE
jgi:tetratricopeptide (TPR) repeat protein